MRNYVTPGKSNSVRFEPRGVWNATVVRVDVGSNEAWVRVPRMSGDLDRGPLLMPSLAAPLAVGDDVLVAFREGKADQLAIVAKVGASGGGGGGSSFRYATAVVAAADSLHPEDADVVCTGTNDDVTIQQIFADALEAGMPVRVLLMEGTFSLDDQGISLDQDESVLEGQGSATRLLFTKPNVYIGLFGSNTAVRNLVCVDEMESEREGLQEGSGTFVELSGNRTSVADCMFDCFRMDRAIYSYGLDTQIVNNTIYGSFGLYDSARSNYGIRIDAGLGTIVAGNTIRMVLPPGWYNDSAGISIWAGKAICSHNWVHVAFPEESDVEEYPWSGAQAQTIWVKGDAITVTGNYAYGWFEDGTWVEFDDTAVIWADSGDGGLISGNVCDGNVAAGANYANTIVLSDLTDGWQVTSNNLWPEYNNGVGNVGSYGYDAVAFGNNPDVGQLDFVSLGGDLGNVLSNASVIRLYGRDLLSTAPTANQVLQWNGSAWAPATLSSDVTGLITVTQGTVGQPVMQLTSTATNDDPTEIVRQFRGTTTNGTATAAPGIGSFTPTAGTQTTVEAVVTARRTGGTAGTTNDGAGYLLYATFRTTAAGTVTSTGTSYTTIGEHQAGWDAQLKTDGSVIYVEVTGALNNNVTWHGTVRSWSVGT
jgi:hypothetical protein